MADIDALTAIIAPETEALGFDLVRVKLFGSGEERTLQIMAERPDTRQLNIDDCAALSRRVSDRIDELEEQGTELIEGAYRLEVSSPGIDRPLTRLADFADWTGHDARVSLVEPVDGRKQFTGELTGIDGDVISLNDRKTGPVSFEFAALHAAKLLLTDRLIAESRPQDSTGADDIEEFSGEASDDVISD